MEALAIAGSIVGLVSLAIQLIGKFQEMALTLPENQAARLDHDLRSSARLLKGVQELAERAKTLHSSSQSGILLHSLAVQLEDYTGELNSWVAVGEREYGRSAPGKSAFSRFSTFINRKSRANMNVGERIGHYEDKISQTLSLIGRQLDVDNTLRLGQLGTEVDRVVQIVTDEACQMTSKLEALSNSSSTILPRSVSSEARLEEATSSIMAEFRELKAVLHEVVSSISSRGSCNGDKKSVDPGPRGRGLVAASESKEPPSRLVLKSGGRLPAVETDRDAVDEHGSDITRQPQSQSSRSHEPEFEMLQKATDDIAKVLRKLYQSTVSEYISMILAWQLLSRFYRAISERDSSHPTHNLQQVSLFRQRTSLTHGKARLRKMTRQLLATRAFCIREGLSDAVVEAEAKFDVGEATRDTWAETDDQNPERKLHWKQILGPGSVKVDTEEAARDRAVQINSWMFSTLEAHPDYVKLHRALYSETNRRVSEFLRKTTASGKTAQGRGDNTQGWSADEMSEWSNMNDESWRALMLQYWFLDETVGSGAVW